MMADSEVLRELRRISKILLLTNAKTIELELAKIATTDDRKKMWVLIDGNRMQKDIADAVGLTQVAVSYFLNAALAAGMIEYKRGEPPRKVFDYVPPAWIDLLSVKKSEKEAVISEKPQVTIDKMTESEKVGGSE